MKDYVIYGTKRILQVLKREGLLQGVRKIFLHGIYKRFKNYLCYLKYKDYHQQNIVFIAALGKSGSSWIANMFSSIEGFERFTPLKWSRKWDSKERDTTTIDLYPGIFDEFTHNLAVIKDHTYGKPQNITLLNSSGLKYLITVRDPRDQIISAYWFIRRRPYHYDYALANNMDLSEFIVHKLTSGEFQRETLNWIRMWCDNRDKTNSMIIKYEDMLDEAFETMKTAINFLGLSVNDSELRKVIEANSFENISGRKRGVEDRSSFLRKGEAGEWKQVFTADQRVTFSSIGEDVIFRLGYEPTING